MNLMISECAQPVFPLNGFELGQILQDVTTIGGGFALILTDQAKMWLKHCFKITRNIIF